MKVKIEQQDLRTKYPIESAVKRQHGLDCIADNRYLVVKGNEKFPRRLPLSAETFMVRLNTGQTVTPFEFEV